MRWHLSHSQATQARALADRHYNRQTPGSMRIAPPGRVLTLVIPGVAVWVSLWQAHADHAWPGAWNNSTFRNEAGREHCSSELIREAVAATRWHWPEVPAAGMITFINAAAVRRKRDPGRCYRRAGFVEVGRTERRGHLVLRLDPADMPPPAIPLGGNLTLFGGAA